MKEKKSISLSFKVTPTFNERIEERAKEEGRGKSNFVIKVLTDYLEKIDEAKKLIGQK